MTEFTSEVKTIFFPQEQLYAALSNMANLEKIKEKKREPPKTIKLTADQSPIELFMWIQLKEGQDADETKMKLTVRAELNPFIKSMVSKPLQEGVDKIADVLTTIPYDQL
jgi:hypothetical protein